MDTPDFHALSEAFRTIQVEVGKIEHLPPYTDLSAQVNDTLRQLAATNVQSNTNNHNINALMVRLDGHARDLQRLNENMLHIGGKVDVHDAKFDAVISMHRVQDGGLQTLTNMMTMLTARVDTLRGDLDACQRHNDAAYVNQVSFLTHASMIVQLISSTTT